MIALFPLKPETFFVTFFFAGEMNLKSYQLLSIVQKIIFVPQRFTVSRLTRLEFTCKLKENLKERTERLTCLANKNTTTESDREYERIRGVVSANIKYLSASWLEPLFALH